MAVVLALLGSLAAFEESPWIVRIFGAIIGLVLLIAVLAWIAFGSVDLYRRRDIGLAKKLLWLAAFVLSAGLVLIIYGAVRFSSTDGVPGI